VPSVIFCHHHRQDQLEEDSVVGRMPWMTAIDQLGTQELQLM
jgi:hypothetical protein